MSGRVGFGEGLSSAFVDAIKDGRWDEAKRIERQRDRNIESSFDVYDSSLYVPAVTQGGVACTVDTATDGVLISGCRVGTFVWLDMKILLSAGAATPGNIVITLPTFLPLAGTLRPTIGSLTIYDDSLGQYSHGSCERFTTSNTVWGPLGSAVAAPTLSSFDSLRLVIQYLTTIDSA